MICKKCSSELIDGFMFCPHCGTKIDPESDDGSPPFVNEDDISCVDAVSDDAIESLPDEIGPEDASECEAVESCDHPTEEIIVESEELQKNDIESTDVPSNPELSPESAPDVAVTYPPAEIPQNNPYPVDISQSISAPSVGRISEEYASAAEKKGKPVTAFFNKFRLVFIIAGAVIILALCLTAVFNFIIPAVHYSNGEKAMESGDFITAEKEFTAAGSYSDAGMKAALAEGAQHYRRGEELLSEKKYFEAAEEFNKAASYKDAMKKAEAADSEGHYVSASGLFDSKKYEDAIKEFTSANGFRDSAEKILECYYLIGKDEFGKKDYISAANNFSKASTYSDAEDMLISSGKMLIGEKKYSDAVSAFGLSDTQRASAYKSYASGLLKMSDKDYIAAIDFFKDSGNTENAPAKLKQANFLQGIILFAKKDYNTAKTYFSAAGDFKNAKIMIYACNGELYNQDGKFYSAVKAYSHVPLKGNIPGCNVIKRAKLFNKYKSFAGLSGEWRATKNYIESRNIHYSTGIWESWYIDKTDTSQTITISCKLNDKGKIDVDGSVNYLYYDNYSSLSEYCNASYGYSTIKMRNLTKFPSSKKLDSETKLLYSKGAFTLKYYVRDNYSVYFYNLYRSTVKYSKRISKS